ncbi:MAG: CarD family transcriptional regulator [Candidatus Saccharibacteria bacterium]|nr:CarD family transcriptional regulator [Candidatus Saccharibacteria bacterium]
MNSIIDTLRSTSQIRLFKKGSAILFQGEIPRKAYIIRDGVVRAYTVKTSGEESTIALYTKDDIFPVPWLLEATSNSLFYYEAVSDVRVLGVTKEEFHKTMMNNTQQLQEMLRYVSKQYTSMLVRITGLSQSRAIEKISFTFYYLLFRYGIKMPDGMHHIDLKLNHLMIANLTGLTRESTTTNLKVLKEKGVINYTRSSFSVNKRKLENFIGEDGFRELNL